MNPKTNPIHFFMGLSISIIVIISSSMRLNLQLSKTNSIKKWIETNPNSTNRSDFPFETKLCSLSGSRIQFWKSMTFRLEFFDKNSWFVSDQRAYSITPDGIHFLWHDHKNFEEEDLPLPDKGRFWKSSSKDYFIYYYGNHYSNLYCNRL